jgi:hypothetical protein
LDPLPARAGLQDIELVAISQEVAERFYNPLARAEDLMMGAPSDVTPKQLRELHIRLNLPQS